MPEQSTGFLLSAITPKETGKKGQTPDPEEDKQVICTFLLAALQKTRALHDLKELNFAPHNVTAVFTSGNKRLINVEADSGIAMVRDILAHL